MSTIMKFTDSEYVRLKEKPGVVVLDFYADWCGPCKALSPALEKVARQNPGVVIGKVNIDENPQTTADFLIKSIPTLVFLKAGHEVGRIIGAVNDKVIESTLNRLSEDEELG